MTKDNKPTRVPNSFRSFANSAAAGVTSERNPPEKKPYRMLKTIAPAALEVPNIPNTKPPEMNVDGMMRLNGPYLSAKKFGTVRPNTEEAFMMEIRYFVKPGRTP